MMSIVRMNLKYPVIQIIFGNLEIEINDTVDFSIQKLIGRIVFRPKTSSIWLRAKHSKKIILFIYQKTLLILCKMISLV